ncbi:beta-glucosidase [Amylostereum chailletii]|nr:beta-glucosidase [Amylostereum chailletii]
MRSSIVALTLGSGVAFAASSSLASLSSVHATSTSTSVSLSGASPVISSASSVVSSASSSSTSASASTTSAASTASGSAIVLPSNTQTIPTTFSPFPSPSSEAAIPGVYPSTSPKNPPPVESPGIVPDFAPAWAAAYKKAKAKVNTFSLEEKVNITTGTGWMVGQCVGSIPAVGDFPGLCLEDGPLSVRGADFTTTFPTGVNTAATWKRSLIRARGLAMGEEHYGKGVQVALGPMMNLGRLAVGGRNWEGFGADPFLAGEAAYETILGLQSAGVQACAKHFINNEQEAQRMLQTSDVDDRTEHELYAAPFLRSVMAGVTSVMCSYNQVNGTYACENSHTLNDILKNEFGFQGYVMSDWFGTHSTESAILGLDLTMPGSIGVDPSESWFGPNLTASVKNGSIPETRVTDMATRILAGWYLLEQDNGKYPAVNFNAFDPLDEATNQHVDVQGDHDKIVREIGAASTVLLKNVDGALPLGKPRKIALIGSDAGPAKTAGPNAFNYQIGTDGILGVGWGSGSSNFSYLISPYEAIQARARKDHTMFSWFFDDFNLVGAQVAARQQDAAIVFLQSDSGENIADNLGDRTNLTALHGGDALVNAVAQVNNNTIVVVHSVGPLVLEPWIENPNVTAVLWAGVSGTETGNSLVDVLYGAVNPSGRLPYTIAKAESDYGIQLINGTDFLTVPYTEGLNIDYRHFDAAGIEPRFEFGYGLSYTQFNYSGLSISKVTGGIDADSKFENNWAQGKPTPHSVGSSTALWLHRPAYKVQFAVKNVGKVAGTEIPQLYLNHPTSANEPPSILRGFTDIELKAGEKQTVTLTLSRYDLSIWDTTHQSWVKPNGTFGISVGASSRDVKLTGTIKV